MASVERALLRCDLSKRGCSFCGLRCCATLRNHLPAIRRWREEMAILPTAVVERELLWIFAREEELPKAPEVEEVEEDGEEERSTTPEDESGADEPPPKTRRSAPNAPSGSNDPPEPSQTTTAEPTQSTTQEESAAEPNASVEETTTEESLTPRIVSSGGSSDEDRPTARPKPRPRAYAARRRGRGRSEGSVNLEGVLGGVRVCVCLKAALCFLGVSWARVDRIRRRIPDRRRRGERLPNDSAPYQPQRATCRRFLWQLYHFVAEGLPDRFDFDLKDPHRGSLTLGGRAIPLPRRLEQDGPDAPTAAEVEDAEDRAVATVALYCQLGAAPASMAVRGPNVHPAPTRYVGVMRPVTMHLLMGQWCARMNLTCPSLQTLLRTLGERGSCIKFRKSAGEHPNCDICVEHKRRLKRHLTALERSEELEAYSRHLLDNWLDRQTDANFVELAHATAQALRDGALLTAMARHSSNAFIRADGMDQAKFKMPRQRTKTHAFAKLVRPALHIQGVWAHALGFHYVAADADMKKDTNTNMEALARMLESIYGRLGGLPDTLTLVQDNTSRECKNQKILKFATKLRIMEVVRVFNLAYPSKGHSHGPLDACFGQTAVKMANEEFDDDEDLVRVLQEFLDDAALDRGCEQDARAYKMDEAADWEGWWDEVELEMSNLTGPLAPHWFQVCCRSDLSLDAQEAPNTAFAGAPASRPDDVVVAIKDRMSSPTAHQVALLAPGAAVPALRARLTVQPRGLHDRRAMDHAARVATVAGARAAESANAISARAAAYLVEWAQGTRRRHPRPPVYQFLRHRFRSADWAPRPTDARGPLRRPPRRVVIHSTAGAPLPHGEEEPASSGDELRIVGPDVG